MQKTLIAMYPLMPLMSFARLSTDVYNVAHAPLFDMVAVGGWLIDYRAVEDHGGRSASIQVVCGLTAQACHELCQFVEAEHLALKVLWLSRRPP